MPEPALQEVKTSAYLAGKLCSFGLEVRQGLGGSTALIGVVPARVPGPVVMLRADMDALPYQDSCGNTFMRHTCGHDAHAAMVLACGREVHEAGGLPAGELRLLFQPAEETMQGAKAVISTGLLEDVDALVGIHLRPKEEAELHCATPALCHGAVCSLVLNIRGRCAHGARPYLGINPIDATALAITAVNAIHMPEGFSHSVKATQISSLGEARNSIPECVIVCFDLRAATNRGMQALLEKTRAAAASAAAAVGAMCEEKSAEGSDAAEYDPLLVELANEAIVKVLGKAMPPLHTSGGEDFHFYHTLAGRRTVYIGLGAGMKKGLHASDMTFDPVALKEGAEILKQLACGIALKGRAGSL